MRRVPSISGLQLGEVLHMSVFLHSFHKKVLVFDLLMRTGIVKN